MTMEEITNEETEINNSIRILKNRLDDLIFKRIGLERNNAILKYNEEIVDYAEAHYIEDFEEDLWDQKDEIISHYLNLAEQEITKKHVKQVKCGYTIIVTLPVNGCGTIETNLKDNAARTRINMTTINLDSSAVSLIYNAAIDGIESLILAQAIAGIDITTDGYGKAVDVAIKAIINQYGE